MNRLLSGGVRLRSFDMQRRRWLLAAGTLTIFTLAGLLLTAALLPPAPAVTWENFERIGEGMSEAEVEAFLGAPGNALPFSADDDFPKEAVKKEWQGEFTQGFVVFDRNGAVLAKGPSFVESGAWTEPRQPPILSHLRRLLP